MLNTILSSLVCAQVVGGEDEPVVWSGFPWPVDAASVVLALVVAGAVVLLFVLGVRLAFRLVVRLFGRMAGGVR